jgi:hypothetical protein
MEGEWHGYLGFTGTSSHSVLLDLVKENTLPDVPQAIPWRIAPTPTPTPTPGHLSNILLL